ncbi:unnamed protein product [Ceutorhynchus assimilis]|uniref:Uncharacterized protein n=1 Tax=Ceutorhynchus assimilis TaxID=467358 RepID=A0A9N9MWF3_9CUCU|nr:unnamed protein product [Ceutorhynchus assimilis]
MSPSTTAIICFTILFTNLQAQQELIVCPPDYCKDNPCQGDSSCPDGEILRPSFCGCCEKCVPEIPFGGSCLELIGVPLPSICEPGTVCCDGTCQYSCE